MSSLLTFVVGVWKKTIHGKQDTRSEEEWSVIVINIYIYLIHLGCEAAEFDTTVQFYFMLCVWQSNALC